MRSLRARIVPVNRLRLIGIIMVVLGIVMPRVIDWYETVHALDIPRDIGVLPWVVMSVIGVVIVTISFRRRRK